MDQLGCDCHHTGAARLHSTWFDGDALPISAPVDACGEILGLHLVYLVCRAYLHKPNFIYTRNLAERESRGTLQAQPYRSRETSQSRRTRPVPGDGGQTQSEICYAPGINPASRSRLPSLPVSSDLLKL